MKIKQIEVFKINLPLKNPYTTGFGKIDVRDNVLVKITTDNGIVGWGETATLPYPMYKYETVDVSILAIRDYLAPLVLSNNIEHPSDLIPLFNKVRGYNFSKAAIDCAVWMIYAIKNDTALYRSIGGKKTEIELNYNISLSDKELMSEAVEKVKNGEASQIKLKIKPGDDIEAVKAIRDISEDVKLMVDANSSYTLSDRSELRKLDKYGLTMIEQPLAEDDIIDHSTLQKELNTPICLDESIMSSEDAKKAIEINACGVINVKPMRVGGLTESINIHEICKSKQVGVWCGGMLESGIGRAHNLAFATLDGINHPSDLRPTSTYLNDDILKEEIEMKNGKVLVSDKAGLGYEVDEKAIKKYTIQHLKL